MILAIKEYFVSLGELYSVDPLIFGAIYIGAIPFFSLSIAWLIRNYKKERSIVLPVIFSGFFFISAYLYLLVVGRNVPLWVYILILVMIIYGIYSTVRKINISLGK